MYIKVRVQAGAKKEAFVATDDTHFVISVKEPAEMNHANRRVIDLVAAHLSRSPKAVRIISGHHSPSKILSVD
jgi:uncharacterized protein YggU (UPF0235/DUF167 family)